MDIEKTIRELSERPDLIPTIADRLDTIGLARLTQARRQREDTAKRRATRAMKSGAPAAVVQRLQARAKRYESLRKRSADMFKVANRPRPIADPEQSTVFVVVTRIPSAKNLDVALLLDDEIVGHGKTDKEGTILLRVPGHVPQAKIQVSSGKRVIYRDSEPFDLYEGDLVFRGVNIVPNKKPRKPPTAKRFMPNLIGQDKAAATVLLRRIGIGSVKISEKKARRAPGTVIAQEPKAGAEITDATPISLTLSKAADKKPPANKEYQAFLIAIKNDDRWRKLSVHTTKPEKVLADARATTLPTIKKIIELENEDMQQRFGLSSLSEARTLRSILRAALKNVT